MKPLALSAFFILFTVGCASTDKIILDAALRPPTDKVDIYASDSPPARSHAIAELTFLGPAQDELRAQKFFVRQAQKLGGAAIIFWKTNANSETHRGFGQSGNVESRFLFHARVIIYENGRKLEHQPDA